MWIPGGFYIMEKQKKVKPFSSVTVKNGNDAWHEPKPPAACLVTFSLLPPPLPRWTSCESVWQRSVTSESLRAWWKRRRESENIFSLKRTVIHLFPTQKKFAFLSKPPTFHVICTFNIYLTVNLCLVLAKGMESVPARVKNVRWHCCSRWRCRTRPLTPSGRQFSWLHIGDLVRYIKNRSNLWLNPGDAGVNFK